MEAATNPEALMRAAPPSVVVLGPTATTDLGNLPATHPEWLADRLRGFVAEVISISEPSSSGWNRVGETIAAAPGAVGVVDVTFVGHSSPLGDTIADSRWGSALLMDDRGFHGVLKIGSADRPAALAAVRVLAVEGAPVRASLLAERLVESGVDLQPIDPGPYLVGFAPESSDPQRLLEEVNNTDEHEIRLAASARPGDGFYSTFVVRRVSRPLTALALRLRMSPNSITVCSLIIGLAAAALFAVGRPWALVAGAISLQVSLVLDCVDGEVARYTRQFTPFGAWLDAVTDRVKEFAVYAGLALGAARSGVDLWLLAGSTLALLVVRHHVDFGFAVIRGTPQTHQPARPTLSAGRVADWSDRTNRHAVQRWAKRVVTMPIGERWLVISVVAPIWGPRAAFLALLATGAVAAAYTTTGRVLRSLSGPSVRSSSNRLDLAVWTEVPLLINAVSPPAWLDGRLAWLTPAGARLLESSAVLALAATLGSPAAVVAFGLLAVVALNLYDVVYRLRHLSNPPRPWASVAVLGSVARPALLAMAALAGTSLFVLAGIVMAAVIIVVSIIEGRTSWVGSAPRERHLEYAAAAR